MLRIAVGTSADLAGSALLRTTGERAPAGLHAAYHPLGLCSESNTAKPATAGICPSVDRALLSCHETKITKKNDSPPWRVEKGK